VSRLDGLLADLQQRVARRRAAGGYPPDLKRRLGPPLALSAGSDETAREAGSVETKSPGSLSEETGAALAALSTARRFDAAEISSTSRSRAGEAAHRALNAALARQTTGILAQVATFAERVEAVLRLVASRLDNLENQHPPILLAAQLDAVLDRLTQLEEPLEQRAALADLRHRVETLEALGRPADAGAWWDARQWVETLDGPFADVVALRAALAATLAGPVLDLSCRRGELLWALRDREVAASGADADARLAATAAGAGLTVAHAGPLVTLARADDASLGAVAALNVAGRLGAQGAADLVALAADKLRFGGRLVVEQPDVEHPRAFADPTAGTPIAAEWIRFACAQVRFGTIDVRRARDEPPGVRPGCYLVTAIK
jgi:hypothetical protein